MRKEEYLKELRRYLKRLPKEDYENAMEYFTEYFEEAGPEGEEDLIKELGTPKQAANDLLGSLLDKKAERIKEKGKKDSVRNIVLIGILLILAAPIGLPVAGAMLLVLLSLLLVLVSAAFGVFCMGGGAILIGVKCLIRGVISCGISLAGGSMVLGMGFLGIGAGILLLFLSYYACKWMIFGVVFLIRNLLKRKGGKKYEKAC